MKEILINILQFFLGGYFFDILWEFFLTREEREEIHWYNVEENEYAEETSSDSSENVSIENNDDSNISEHYYNGDYLDNDIFGSDENSDNKNIYDSIPEFTSEYYNEYFKFDFEENSGDPENSSNYENNSNHESNDEQSNESNDEHDIEEKKKRAALLENLFRIIDEQAKKHK